MAAARSRKKQNGVLPWIALLLLAVVVATFVYAHVHVVSQHHLHPHMPPPRQRQLEEPVIPTMIETPAPSQPKRRKTINDVAHELDPMDRLLEQSRMRHGVCGHGQEDLLCAEPGHRLEQPLLCARCLCGRRVVPFHRVDVSFGAGHWETHVEHG
jgi:hypothetical protein